MARKTKLTNTTALGNMNYHEPDKLTYFMVFTPELASAWLTKYNIKNPRRMYCNTAKKYARLMAEGKWCATTNSINIDKNGRMISGQHRLEAVVISGIPVEMLVVTGCHPDSRLLVDTHKEREMWDHLGCEKYQVQALNVMLRAIGVKYHKHDLDVINFYKKHINGRGVVGSMAKKLHQTKVGYSGPIVGWGIRTAIILLVLNKHMTPQQGVDTFKDIATWRKNFKGNYVVKDNDARQAAYNRLPKLMQVLLSKYIDHQKMPVYDIRRDTKFSTIDYGGSDIAQKLVYAAYQALHPDTCDDVKFTAPLGLCVKKSLGIKA